jgi:acyl-CoA thioester hydrolase
MHPTDPGAPPWAAFHTDCVRPEWVDSNGHMNLAYYIVVFDLGTDAWMDLAGLSAAYRAAEQHTVFAVETHTLYRQELRQAAPIQVRTWLVGADSKRIHLAHEMTSDGAVAALHEVLFVHVSLATRRVAPLGPAAAARLAGLSGGPRPDWLGRRIVVPAAPAFPAA